VHAQAQGTKRTEDKARRVLVVAELLGAFVLVVIAADSFTNAVEWIDARTKLTRGATGAIVAAIGSSLPETVVTVIALVVLGDPRSQAIGIGAVIGAPFMLATVIFSLIGVIALLRGTQGGRPPLAILPAPTIFGGSLFFATFALALAASFVRARIVHEAAVVLVLAAYALYLWYHLREQDQISEDQAPALRIAPKAKNPSVGLVVLQLSVALVLMIVASRMFIASLWQASFIFGISPLLMSLYLSPIATELPEASNVALWMRRKEDNLAMSNVLGAMMFQTSIACAIGIWATSWQLTPGAYVAGIASLAAVALVVVTTIVRRRVEPVALVCAGLLYLAYVAFSIFV
jgi:cation:H+ antiporter